MPLLTVRQAISTKLALALPVLLVSASVTISGHSCAGGAAAPVQCTAGTYAAQSDGTCTACLQASGQYCPFVAMEAPFTCPAGFKLSANTQTCTPCTAGKECTDSATETTCAAGTFAFGGAAACTDCTSTPYGCSGSTAALCDVTKYTNAGACAACTAGNECLDRQSLTNCAAGEYNVLADDFHACYPCPAGKKCTSASANPVACAAG